MIRTAFIILGLIFWAYSFIDSFGTKQTELLRNRAICGSLISFIFFLIQLAKG